MERAPEGAQRDFCKNLMVIPAIDLKGGRCVRLRQGKAEEVTVYSDNPVEMALHWEREGGEFLHVVDLDGAFEGRPVHHEAIGRIARAVSIPVEVGGGLRTDADIEMLLRCGVARVVLGTRAWQEPGELKRLIGKHGEAIVVGIDARGGFVQVKGWTETTPLRAEDLARQADGMGARTIVFTNTATDGMLSGPDTQAVGSLCDAVSCRVIASGGIASAVHLRALRELNRPNLAGAIVGKALYDGTVTLQELIEEAKVGL